MSVIKTISGKKIYENENFSVEECIKHCIKNKISLNKISFIHNFFTWDIFNNFLFRGPNPAAHRDA